MRSTLKFSFFLIGRLSQGLRRWWWVPNSIFGLNLGIRFLISILFNFDNILNKCHQIFVNIKFIQYAMKPLLDEMGFVIVISTPRSVIRLVYLFLDIWYNAKCDIVNSFRCNSDCFPFVCNTYRLPYFPYLYSKKNLLFVHFHGHSFQIISMHAFFLFLSACYPQDVLF